MFLLPVLLLGCDRLSPEAADMFPAPVEDVSGPYVEGMFRVKLREPMDMAATRGGGPDERFRAAMSRAGVYSVRRSFSDGDRFRGRRQKAGLDRWYDVYFMDSCTVTEAMERFGMPEQVEIIEPVPRMFPVSENPAYGTSLSAGAMPFNDPFAKNQWYIFNGFTAASCWSPDAHLNILPAWKASCGSSDVVVAVVDGGVDFTHPDLRDAMWDDGQGNCGYNFVVRSNDIVPSDHGTAVAAIIGAVNNNSEGICGIAGGDGGGGVRIMSCQVFDDRGSSADIGEFMAYAADNGAVISQNSWNYVGLSDLSQYGKDAIDYFIRNAGFDENGIQTGPMAGGVVIFAAGNSGVDTPQYPAAYGPVIAVASLDADFSRASTSNYGDWVDISAFGGSPGIYTAGTGGAYGYVTGTSVAAPEISGLAALAVSWRGGEGFTNEDLLELLLGSGRLGDVEKSNPGYGGLLGSGVPDAEYVMFYGMEPSPVIDASAYGHRYHIGLEWTVPECYAGLPVCEYDVYASKSSLDGLDPGNPGSDVLCSHVTLSGAVCGQRASCIVGGLEEMTEYNIAVVSRTKFGMASDAVLLKGSTIANSAPYVTAPIEDIVFSGTGKEHEISISLMEHFADDDFPEDRLVCFAEAASDGIVSCRADEERLYVTPVSEGSTTLTVVVSDRDGAMVSTCVNVISAGELLVYPNPFEGYFNVRLPGYEGSMHLKLYDRAGRPVFDTSVMLSDEGARVDAPGLSSGTYRLVAEFGGKRVEKPVVRR